MIIYTDGSCRGNGKDKNVGGHGIVVLDDDENIINAYAFQEENTTNNRQELQAILFAMMNYGVCIHNNPLLGFEQASIPIVYSDSAYCVNTFNDWMFKWAVLNWVKSDGKTPENLDLIQAYYERYMAGYRIDLRKVRGHSNNKWNNLADELATGKTSPEDIINIWPEIIRIQGEH